MAVGGHSLFVLAAGVVLMDAGVQGSHISNQTRIYALHPALRNRLNSGYMVTYFLGGTLGFALGRGLGRVQTGGTFARVRLFASGLE